MNRHILHMLEETFSLDEAYIIVELALSALVVSTSLHVRNSTSNRAPKHRLWVLVRTASSRRF